MAKNFKQRGETIKFPADADVSSGALIIKDGLAVVNLNDARIGDQIVAQTEGVWELPAVAAAVANVGAVAYATPAGTVTGASAGNTRIGRFWQALAANETSARVKINVA